MNHADLVLTLTITAEDLSIFDGLVRAFAFVDGSGDAPRSCALNDEQAEAVGRLLVDVLSRAHNANKGKPHESETTDA